MLWIERQIQNALLVVIDWAYRPFQRWVARDFFRYGFAGASNMLLDWVLYFVFYHYVFRARVFDLGFIAFTPHIASFLLKFPIIFLTGFWLNRHISFAATNGLRHTQLMRYLLVVLACIGINYVCLKFFVEWCGFYPTPSNILTTIVATIFSYFAQKYFTFRTKTRA